MGRLPGALVLAAAIHSVAFAWIARRDAPRRVPPIVARATPEAAPVEITLYVDEPALPLVEAPAPPASVRPGAGTHAMVAATRVTSHEAASIERQPEPIATPNGHAHSALMTMRGTDLAIDPSRPFVGAFLGGSKPVETVAPPTGELEPSGHGTYKSDLGEDLERVATAHVQRDGTVHFEDAPDFDLRFVGFAIVGKAGVDDWLMRKTGLDPYAGRKRAWLDKTRDERARIGGEHRAQDLAQSASFARRNADALWAATSDLLQRKVGLFELWDDVAETGDAALVDGGAAARAYLIGVIRARLPATSADAFTADELARFNARRKSAVAFAPYD